MLRTVTNIVTSCLLLVSTTGLAVSKHYCGGDLVSVELKTEADACCDDGMCCNTETQFLQLEEDFIASTTSIDLRNLFSADLIQPNSAMELLNSFHYHYYTSIIFPDVPPPHPIPVRLALHQVYRL
jgi:hypothetical protein